MQKKWSHIDPHLIGPLDEKEVSLKVTLTTTSSPHADLYVSDIQQGDL